MLVIVGTRTDAHSLRSQVGIGSESDCLLGQLDRVLRISDSETQVCSRPPNWGHYAKLRSVRPFVCLSDTYP